MKKRREEEEEEEPIEDIPFINIKFSNACGLLGGEYKKLGDDLAVCEIRKGLESYVIIEKQGRGIEVYTKSPRGIEHIADLDRFDHTFCDVAVDIVDETPIGSLCEFYKKVNKLNREDFTDNGSALGVTVEPPRSIIVSKHFLAVRSKDGMVIPLSFRNKDKVVRLRIHKNFRDAFETIYRRRVEDEMREIGLEKDLEMLYKMLGMEEK